MTEKLHRAWQHALNSQVVTGKESDNTVSHATQVTDTRNAHKVSVGIWLLTLREERRLRVSGNRVLRRVFGPKRDEVTGEWRKLHNETLNVCTPYPILCGW